MASPVTSHRNQWPWHNSTYESPPTDPSTFTAASLPIGPSQLTAKFPQEPLSTLTSPQAPPSPHWRLDHPLLALVLFDQPGPALVDPAPHRFAQVRVVHDRGEPSLERQGVPE